MSCLPSAMVSCVVALGAALGIAITGVLLFRFLLARHHLAAFPGPAPRFLLGNLAMLVDEGGKVMPLFRLHHVLAQRYGAIARFTMGSTPVLIVSGVPSSTSMKH